MANFPLTSGDLTNPIPTVLLFYHEQCIFIVSWQFKDKFHCQESVIYNTWGVRLRESVNKINLSFILKSVRFRLRESVRLLEWVNTELCWEVKWSFEKASVGRAGRLRECPLAES